jgi:hypothetical protein
MPPPRTPTDEQPLRFARSKAATGRPPLPKVTASPTLCLVGQGTKKRLARGLAAIRLGCVVYGACQAF